MEFKMSKMEKNNWTGLPDPEQVQCFLALIEDFYVIFYLKDGAFMDQTGWFVDDYREEPKWWIPLPNEAKA